MKIGLYFGSFNPIHVGHLIIANFMAYNTGLEQVWLVVSPQNPLKSGGSLLNEYDRLYLVQMAIENEPRLKVSNIEFSLPNPSFTIDTMTYLEEKYPEHEFSIIMGSDSLENLPRWKNYEQLLARFPVFVYIRPGHEAKKYPDSQITICEAPLLDISSSRIRKMIKAGKSVRFMIPERVYEYMLSNRYYQQ
jgi:nicotinate-nucleotide adenylyltransferase